MRNLLSFLPTAFLGGTLLLAGPSCGTFRSIDRAADRVAELAKEMRLAVADARATAAEAKAEARKAYAFAKAGGAALVLTLGKSAWRWMTGRQILQTKESPLRALPLRRRRKRRRGDPPAISET